MTVVLPPSPPMRSITVTGSGVPRFAPFPSALNLKLPPPSDRIDAFKTTPLMTPLNLTPPFSCGSNEPAGMVAVSYTHLTLPTILRV